MEAAQIEARPLAQHDVSVGVDRSPVPPVAAVSTFLAESGRAHHWFLDALSGLARDLIDGPGELSRVVSEQQRLLRQFLDAQRSILRYWAEVDAEVQDILTRRALATGVWAAVHEQRPDEELDRLTSRSGSSAETQLRMMLDDFWRIEHAAGRMLIETTRSAGTHAAAERAAECAGSAWHREPDVLQVTGAPTPPFALGEFDDVFDVLADETPIDVLAVIDRLVERLVVPVDGAAAPSTPEPVLPAIAPAAAQTIGDPDAFARFWGAGRSDDRGWRNRPFVHALVPLVSGFVVLTGVLAWIG